MHGEPYLPLPTNAGTKLDLTGAGGEISNLREHLLNLDAALDRRAASVEAELREIAQVRKAIKLYLAPPGNSVGAPQSSDFGGASLGQMI